MDREIMIKCVILVLVVIVWLIRILVIQINVIIIHIIFIIVIVCIVYIIIIESAESTALNKESSKLPIFISNQGPDISKIYFNKQRKEIFKRFPRDDQWYHQT